MKLKNLLIMALITTQSINAVIYTSEDRIKNHEIGELSTYKLNLAPARNLMLTEICDGVDTKKILYPTKLENDYNYVLPSNGPMYTLPVTVGRDKFGNTLVSELPLGQIVLGTESHRTSQEVIFSPKTNNTLPYDLGTKMFRLDKGCSYKLTNELVYKIISDNLEDLTTELRRKIILETSSGGNTSDSLIVLLEKIGVLELELESLGEATVNKNSEYATLLDEKAVLLLEMEVLIANIERIEDESVNYIDYTIQIEDFISEINSKSVEIIQIQEELEQIMINYEVKRVELLSKSKILSEILSSSTTKAELEQLIASTIAPNVMIKQKYNIEHLKGDIVPSKLIRIDE